MQRYAFPHTHQIQVCDKGEVQMKDNEIEEPAQTNDLYGRWQEESEEPNSEEVPLGASCFKYHNISMLQKSQQSIKNLSCAALTSVRRPFVSPDLCASLVPPASFTPVVNIGCSLRAMRRSREPTAYVVS